MSRPRINLLRIEEEPSEVHLRLAGVTIEHLPWQLFIKAYDKSGTFFFLDPPYYKARYYSHNFKINDFQVLADTLAGVRSDFVLTINDHPEMHKVFAGFTIQPVLLSYSAAQDKCTQGRELIVSN